jgi:hypothetical protein
VIGCNEEIVFTDPEVTDNCDQAPAVSIVSTATEPGPGLCEETHTRCWIAEDACGNVSDPCYQSIVRRFDVEPPVLVPAPDEEVACNQPIVFTDPEVTDGCDPGPGVSVVSTVVEPGPGPCEETHTRCWVAEDACGNECDPVCQTIVTMVDTIPPVLTCAPDRTIPYGEAPVFDEPVMADNCSATGQVQEVSTEFSEGPGVDQESYTRCWIAYDECGNESNECCQTITVDAPPDPYCTFSCQDWIAGCPSGSSQDRATVAGCILEDHFDELYPDGVRIGVEGPGTHTATWTSPEAIQAFGCGFGYSRVLDRDYVNPTRYDILGYLAGDILTLRLNRDFSCAGHFMGLGYPALEGCLGNFVIPAGDAKFGGLSVDEFLAVADEAIGGNTAVLSEYGASLNDLSNTTSYLNSEFSGCNAPDPVITNLISGYEEEGALSDNDALVAGSIPGELGIVVRPNPLTGDAILRLALPAEGEVSVELYDIRGRRVMVMLRRRMGAGYHDFAWNSAGPNGMPVASGVYFCRVEVGGQESLMIKLVKL